MPGPVDPWGNQVGEVVPEQYRLAGREIFRLPTGPLPTTVLVAEEEDEEPAESCVYFQVSASTQWTRAG